MKSDTQALTL